MENVKIQTSQNVDIIHNIASVGERLLSTLLDYCFLGSFFMSVIFIAEIFGINSTGFFVISILPLILYHVICEIFFNGQSIGKMLLKLKVVKIDGTQASIGSYIIRWVFRLVDVMIMYGLVGLLTILINGKGQRLGDIAARTTVIRIDRKTSLKDTIHIKLPEDYQIIFPQAVLLSEKDIYTIKETLEYYQRNKLQHNAVLIANKAKQVVENKIKIKSELHPEKFFQTIIKDYNSLNNS